MDTQIPFEMLMQEPRFQAVVNSFRAQIADAAQTIALQEARITELRMSLQSMRSQVEQAATTKRSTG